MNGTCQSWIISSGTDPGPPVVDSTYIYWPDNVKTSDGGILRASKTGGSATPLTPGQDHPNAVAVDGTSIYWVTNSITGPAYGGVYKTALGGGVPMTLASTTQGTTWIVVNSTNIYWDDHGTNQIQRANLDGSNAAVIAMAGVAGPLQMAIDSQFVYWASRSGGAIQKTPLFGSGATALATGTDPIGVAVNSSAIFWANYGDGTIQKAALPNGGTAVTIASSAGFGANNIAADEKYVYWADLGAPGGKTIDGGPSGTVRAASVNGNGSPGIVLAESLNPSYVTVDAACVYWTDATSGNVGVVAKP